MNKQDCILLFKSIYPNHFEREVVRGLPDDLVFDEMILPLDEFDIHKYDKKFDDSITFGFYDGDIDELRSNVKKVVEYWAEHFNENDRIYCGYIDGKIASFCCVNDMGTYKINGREIKIGGPGCVGTLPEYRNRGIGLTMVKNVTQILKEEGFDYSYIHFTGIPEWYGKLRYKTSVKWNRNGII